MLPVNPAHVVSKEKKGDTVTTVELIYFKHVDCVHGPTMGLPLR